MLSHYDDAAPAAPDHNSPHEVIERTLALDEAGAPATPEATTDERAVTDFVAFTREINSLARSIPRGESTPESRRLTALTEADLAFKQIGFGAPGPDEGNGSPVSDAVHGALRMHESYVQADVYGKARTYRWYSLNGVEQITAAEMRRRGVEPVQSLWLPGSMEDAS